MLSVRTLQNTVVHIQNLGNILGVDPVIMNTNGAGVVENCKIIYSGTPGIILSVLLLIK